MLICQDKFTWTERTWTEYERVAKKMSMLARMKALRKPNEIRRYKLLHTVGLVLAILQVVR
jgi:hypothetical protein